MMSLSRGERFASFVERLATEIDAGNICFQDGKDIVLDFGLQDHLRDLLDCFAPAWLLPAMATILGKPVTADPAQLYAGFVGRFQGVDDSDRRDRMSRIVMRRLFALLVLLDEAAACALLPAHAPAPFAPGAAYTSTDKLMHHLQRLLLAKEGNVCIHLRKLGASLSYKQSSALGVPLPSYPIEPSAILDPKQLINGALFLRCVMGVNAVCAPSLAGKLSVPARQKWQLQQNAEAILLGAESAGTFAL